MFVNVIRLLLSLSEEEKNDLNIIRKGVSSDALSKKLEVEVVVGDPIREHDLEILKQLIKEVAKRKLLSEVRSLEKEAAQTHTILSNSTPTTQHIDNKKKRRVF